MIGRRGFARFEWGTDLFRDGEEIGFFSGREEDGEELNGGCTGRGRN